MMLICKQMRLVKHQTSAIIIMIRRYDYYCYSFLCKTDYLSGERAHELIMIFYSSGIQQVQQVRQMSEGKYVRSARR